MLTRKTPLRRFSKPMKRTPLRRVSKKRRAQMGEYSVKRKAFLYRPENRYCRVWLAGVISGNSVRATEVHHVDGREGSLLNNEATWLAVSRAGHTWIHEHPNEARKRGWLV